MTVVVEFTEFVIIGNVADVAPAATVTLAGTLAADALLLVSETVAPYVGAGAFSITLPLEEDPPAALVGLTVTDESAAEDVWDLL